MFCPVHDSRFVDAEASSRFCRCQHTAAAKPIVSRANFVSMHEIGDTQSGKFSAAASRSSRSTGLKSLPIEDISDFGIDVVIEEFVHKLDDPGLGLHLLSGWLGIRRRQRFSLTSLEAEMNCEFSARVRDAI
jgi:hypothetical protein